MHIEVECSEVGARSPLSLLKLRSLTRAALAMVPDRPSSLYLSIAFVGKKRSQDLNRRYRGKDQPTDILSFRVSNHRYREGHLLKRNDRSTPYIGELILCPPIIRVRAREHGVTFQKETIALVLHGLLHLFGFDHSNDAAYRKMYRRERILMKEA